MENFTPASALLGGLLIGVSTALFLVLNGRIAGISGIVGRLLQPTRSDLGRRLAFLAGLLMAPVVYTVAGGSLPPVRIDASAGLLIMAGLLVGFATRLGAGCGLVGGGGSILAVPLLVYGGPRLTSRSAPAPLPSRRARSVTS